MSEKTGLLVANGLDILGKYASIVDLGNPTSDMADHDQYAPDAIVPTRLRALHDSNDVQWLESRLATRRTPALGRIALVRPLSLSTERLGELKQYADDHLPDAESSHLQQGRTRSLSADIPEGLWRPHGTLPSDAPSRLEYEVHDIFVSPSRRAMRTSTRMWLSEGQEQRVGVHLDNYFRQKDAEQRLKAPSRFGLNLGPGERSVIISSDILDIEGEFRHQKPDESGLTYTRSYNKWRLESGQPLRAIVLRVPVGIGYVCPTEAVLHDGSKLGVTEDNDQSQAAFWVGDFFTEDPAFDESFEIVT